MSEQESQESNVQRPTTVDRNEWKRYWESQDMPWRTEPEVTEERQRQLNECRVFPSEMPGFDMDTHLTSDRRFTKDDYDFTKDTMPSFQGIEPKLCRADIEWLLATQDFGRGPVHWHEPTEIPYPWRRGLDLRGSDLRSVDLSGLPLSCLRAGCMEDDMYKSTSEERERQAAHLEHANLRGANLECALLGWTHLDRAILEKAHIELAYLGHARLQEADLGSAYAIDADFTGAQLQDAYCANAYLQGASLWDVHAERAEFHEAELQGAWFHGAHLEGAILSEADFGGGSIPSDLLKAVRQWDEDFASTMPPARLSGVFFDAATNLRDINLGDEEFGYVTLADVHWGDAILAVVNWTRSRRGFLGLGKRIDAIELGEEREASHAKERVGDQWVKGRKLELYRNAVRANRQLATALRNQGLNEDADRFAYKAQKLQREVLRRQGQWVRWFGSRLIDAVAGYGYRPWRAFGAYAFFIVLFMGLYLLNSQFVSPHLTWNEALVLSMSSFHGRGFFNPNIQLGDTYAQLAAIEAFVGLIIEVSFIATFTQRFFAR